MNVDWFFVADAQPTELIQPGESPFYYPSLSAQSAALFGVTPNKGKSLLRVVTVGPGESDG